MNKSWNVVVVAVDGVVVVDVVAVPVDDVVVVVVAVDDVFVAVVDVEVVVVVVVVVVVAVVDTVVTVVSVLIVAVVVVAVINIFVIIADFVLLLLLSLFINYILFTIYKMCRWLDTKCGPLVSEATAQLTEPQSLINSLGNHKKLDVKFFLRVSKGHYRSMFLLFRLVCRA